MPTNPPTAESAATAMPGLSANLPLDQTLQILDVARTMRQQRETIDRQFEIDDVKGVIRDKLLKASEITGGEVSAAEVDLAIQRYYDSLFRFQEPQGFEATLARIYVRRWAIVRGMLALGCVAFALWYFLLGGPLSARGRQIRRAESLATEVRERQKTLSVPIVQQAAIAGQLQQINRDAEIARKRGDLAQLEGLKTQVIDLDQRLRNEESRAQQAETLAAKILAQEKAIRALAKDPTEIDPPLAGLTTEVNTAREQHDLTRLQAIHDRITRLDQELQVEYEVRIVTDPGKKSGLDLYHQDANKQTKSAGYYLIVHAVATDGKILPRTVRDDISQAEETVSFWAERVPKEVYDRIREDKKSDGILNETLVAVKPRGRLAENYRIPGADGKPLTPQGRIGHW